MYGLPDAKQPAESSTKGAAGSTGSSIPAPPNIRETTPPLISSIFFTAVSALNQLIFSVISLQLY